MDQNKKKGSIDAQQTNEENLSSLRRYIEETYDSLEPPISQAAIEYHPCASFSERSIPSVPDVTKHRESTSHLHQTAPHYFPDITPQPGFASALLAALNATGITNAQCYTRANIDRKHFSKILCQPYYKPRKPVAIALILSLDPTLEEMNRLLETLGYCLSHSSVFDLVIEWCVLNHVCKVDDINVYLDKLSLPLLGSY